MSGCDSAHLTDVCVMAEAGGLSCCLPRHVPAIVALIVSACVGSRTCSSRRLQAFFS